jgi:PAS domain S-box-containing protein
MQKSHDIAIRSNATIAEMLNDCSIDRFMAIDMEWNIIAWNRISEKLTGIGKKDIIGKKLMEVFPQFGEDREMLNAIRLAMSGIKSFVPAQKNQFNRHHYENHFIPLTMPDGGMVGVMNLMHDVAHRIKAEQQLHKLNIDLKKKYEQLERTADELATLTYITTHNIKDPLRQFYASLELLVRAEGRALSDGGKANLRRMQSSLNRMTLLLDDILALSGINNLVGEETPVNLEEIMKQAVDKLKDKIRSNNVQIQSAGLPTITGYPEMLYYLFYYLINNAIKFRKHDAPLHVTISSTSVTLPGDETERTNKTDGAGKTEERKQTKKDIRRSVSSTMELASARKMPTDSSSPSIKSPKNTPAQAPASPSVAKWSTPTTASSRPKAGPAKALPSIVTSQYKTSNADSTALQRCGTERLAASQLYSRACGPNEANASRQKVFTPDAELPTLNSFFGHFLPIA